MRQTELTRAIEKTVTLKLKAVDRLVDELVEPLAKVGNPEELIKKPYENWDENDLAILTEIYGPGDNTPLANLIFNREYQKVKQLESEEAM